MKPNQEGSPLLRLSGELRNHIFQYALGGNYVSPYPLSFDSAYFYLTCRLYGTQEADGEDAWENLFDLGRTCRQLYHETKLLPYKLNVFNISLDGSASNFLNDMDDAKKKVITTLSFSFMRSCHIDLRCVLLSLSKLLKQCTGLTTVITDFTFFCFKNLLVDVIANKMGVDLMFTRERILDKTWNYLDVVKELDEFEWWRQISEEDDDDSDECF